MKILNNKLKNDLNIRTQKDFPINGIEFIDITPLIMQKDTFKEIVNLFVNEINPKNVDYIIAPEARGFLIGSAVATNLDVGCIPVRKKGKLPYTFVRAEAEYEKEYGKDILELPKLINDDYNNKNFYILDDIYATGNTMKAITEAVEKIGGRIVGKGAIINIKELNNDNVFALIEINEE